MPRPEKPTIYEIVGTKKRGLEIPKAVAEEILPESVMEQATQDGEALCFTDPVSNAIVADALLEQELVIDPKAAAQLEAIRQLDDVSYYASERSLAWERSFYWPDFSGCPLPPAQRPY